MMKVIIRAGDRLGVTMMDRIEREENDSLRCQLEAYKNEVDLVRSDLKTDLDQKDKQLKMLQQTLQGMQQKSGGTLLDYDPGVAGCYLRVAPALTAPESIPARAVEKQLMESKRRQAEDDVKVRELQARLKTANVVQARLQHHKGDKDEVSGEEVADPTGGGEPEEEQKVDTTECPIFSTSMLTDREARLIGLISTFLHVHPFGAGVDYIWSYLQKLDPTLRPGEVELLMSRFPTVFRQELSGIGANMERRWLFFGFNATATAALTL
uniref:Ecto-NOX disulfide-thiol exchanger 1/2 domain-containing protein n=1 Tax=Timema monikensis TaxID=170555 RepID=A0A7R9EEN8_9NEOP|nr:unnamed protein product [Timema monikensis]